MRLHVGTSGYAYKEWKGVFYPEKLPPKNFLSYYGQHFDAVEINNTFYRMPKETVLIEWAKQVPADFTFVLKASRRITHFKRLKDTNEELGYFAQTASVLGPRLGPTLFQLPPNLKLDTDRLAAFLKSLPKHWRGAFEFREASWQTAVVHDLLRDHHQALVVAETGDADDVPVITTADWGYLRLRKVEYTDAELRTWVQRIQAQSWDDVFVFFKHEDKGSGPLLAKRFLELWGKR